MHLSSQKLQLRPKLTAVLQHSSKNSISKTPEASTSTKPASSINIKDKRNIKIGIVALRTVSKWTDKAALTLEKLEGQEASKHCQDRQARLLAEDGSKGYGKQVQYTGVWRETVVYPVPAQVGSTRGIEAHEQPRVYGAAALSSKGESQIPATTVEAPLVQTHHAHVLASVEEYYDESSDDEEGGSTSKQIGINSSTHVDADEVTDEEDTSDDSSDDEKEDDSDNEKESDTDSDDDLDSEAHDSSDDVEDSDEEEMEAKHPTILNSTK
ncbi:uncharacterized protein J4E84_004617 [Alternaria hordeiaustralica]|uniref:uncharacterized protein n=1 Tax=Alternaria hordeiaustralica TaxID=1187925 RepID=UPI0020C59D18|nr:uncharacterized protein J4E84_004617 [Alternaria hordeiaustralica]KAI4688687.1 hypothetical protein J4E84_004617 [Alternaria hordeiaustralica]